MEKRERLKELIEHERKHLDEIVELGLDREAVYVQSRKIDALIGKYYEKN